MTKDLKLSISLLGHIHQILPNSLAFFGWISCLLVGKEAKMHRYKKHFKILVISRLLKPDIDLQASNKSVQELLNFQRFPINIDIGIT